MGEDSPVAQGGSEDGDPFRTDGAAPRPPPSPTGPPDDAPPTPEVRATALRLALVSVAGMAAAFFAPPVGAVLGVVAVVLAVRARHSVPRRTRVLAIGAGSVAVVVGLTITGVGLLFRDEITQYSRCLQAANTVQARQNCQDTLNESLSSKLGL
jgi:hypothetical protein